MPKKLLSLVMKGIRSLCAWFARRTNTKQVAVDPNSIPPGFRELPPKTIKWPAYTSHYGTKITHTKKTTRNTVKSVTGKKYSNEITNIDRGTTNKLQITSDNFNAYFSKNNRLKKHNINNSNNVICLINNKLLDYLF